MEEARRAMEVCNACRYCEGFCAVFPAMERRRAFSGADLTYLANLCHGCHGCFYACQYAPPHAFGINVPKVFSELRHESFAAYAWPAPLATLFRRNGLFMALATAFGVGGVLLLALVLQDDGVLFGAQPGFYAVVPYPVMVWVAGTAFMFSLVALAVGFARFWKHTGGGPIPAAALLEAMHDAATLRNLGGGGYGCNDTDEGFSTARRGFHHLMAYGFLLCFAATAVATVYHHALGWKAPYAFLSAPVLLGTAGGLGMVAGTSALFWLKLTGDREPRANNLLGADAGLLLLLLLIALTGLLLLAVRATGAMGVVLAVHLGCVLAFFVAMPYSKFVHAPYRLAALLRNAIERRAAPEL
jgi:citrate/tricarballylate utilization protein